MFGVFALIGCESDTLYEPTGPDPSTPPPSGTPGAEPGAGVSIQIDVGDRIERTDSLSIDLSGYDPSGVSGVARLGYSLVITHPDGSQQAVTDEFVASQGPAGDTISTNFTFRPDWLSEADLPRSFDLQAYGWVLNRAGDCAAAVPEGSDTSLDCRIVQIGSETVRIATAGASPIEILGVAGRTTLFPTDAIIAADLAVDVARENLFISNRRSNVLHHFDPAGHQWVGTVAVGSEPWGLHMNRTGDTLLVANSGGTSLSYVALSDGGAQEVVSRRLQTRNNVLYEFALTPRGGEDLDDDADDEDRVLIVDEFSVYNFSDRPQFVAQDAAGRVLYSTRPTAVAPTGTARWVENRSGWDEPETRIIVRPGTGSAREEVDLVQEDNSLVIAHADSVVVYFDGEIEIFDHRPGFPGQIISSGKAAPLDAVQTMRANPLSDVLAVEDVAWNLEAISFSDTTYVASSADREFVAFGDGGAAADPGKILLWHSGTGTLSSRLRVEDLVNNASERVRALQLNGDGSLGVARGAFGTYFFSNDLRLRGTVPESEMGGGGAALHPGHPNTPAPSASTTSTLAFTVSADRTVRILDTVHYLERGRIPIRDAISGPMRVTGPLSSDNNGQGSSCQGQDCVVAKLYAVTDAGGVVVVDIRASHISPAP
ncbi:MAG: hypothetical protein EA351_10090 [Gemmatimonadales bacterium]|nr:MAG: hypothetical protein EA351_10090 [Gemmatimonadales bacterium]